jgi:hypothetical protein
MMVDYLTGLTQPAGPALDPVAQAEATVVQRSFITDLRTKVRHEDGSLESVEPRGFAITWTCCGKGLGTTYLMAGLPEGYGVGASHRAGGRMTVERETKIRFQCPRCGRDTVVRADRILAALVAQARRFPEVDSRRVAADIRILD